MTDKHDKLVEMARDCGLAITSERGQEFRFTVPQLAAFRSAILADAAKDVEPVGEVMLGYSTELEKCYPDGPMNHVHWNEKSAVPCAGSDIYSASTVASLASTLAAAQALNAELVARVEGLEKDAARWAEVLLRVGAARLKPCGRAVFTFDNMPKPKNSPMVGSVSGHFTDAIDAAIAARSGT